MCPGEAFEGQRRVERASVIIISDFERDNLHAFLSLVAPKTPTLLG